MSMVPLPRAESSYFSCSKAQSKSYPALSSADKRLARESPRLCQMTDIHLACYANEHFRQAQMRLSHSALLHGVDKVCEYGPKDLEGTDFWIRHKDILVQSKGAGYYLWKPWVILQVLQQTAPGDFVLYVDSGAEIVADVRPLMDVAKSASGILLFGNHGRPNRFWNKRDCYVLMDCDTIKCHEAEQVNAAFLGFIAGPLAEGFVKEWLSHCTDPRKLTDMPSQCGQPELPGFIENRYDQSVLSLLAFKKGMHRYRDPSQYGNHLKLIHLRVPGEYLQLPYAAPRTDSPYGTLFNHHRETSASPSSRNRMISSATRTARAQFRKKFPTFGVNQVHLVPTQFTSELGEDKWVASILYGERYFVDIGAGDGAQLSNTYVLEKCLGWRGLCIEPSDDFQLLRQIRNCFVDDSSVADPFSNSAKTVGGSLRLHADHSGNIACKKTTTLTSLLDQYGCPEVIDYLSLSTGGSPYLILKNFAFKRYSFRLITAAHNFEESLRMLLFELLRLHGYSHARTIGHTDWYVHPTHLSFSQLLRVRANQISPHIPSRWRPKIRRLAASVGYH